MKKILGFSLCVIALVLMGCGGEDDGPSTGVFDRKAMLTRYADQLILPSYAQLEQRVIDLETGVLQLVAQPTEAQRVAVLGQWEEAAIAWQQAQMFNFGPAGEADLNRTLVEEIGTFPASVTKITAYIASEDTVPGAFERDARGLYALEFLLVGDNGFVDVVDRLKDRVYAAYVRNVVRDIRSRVSTVHDAWQNGYREDFISRDGTDVGSGTAQLYNAWVQRFEAAKNFKVGLPLGLRPGQTGPQPELVESFFYRSSKTLLSSHLEAIGTTYFARDFNGQAGVSLYEYVKVVEGGEALAMETLAQWEQVQSALISLSNSALHDLAANEDPTLIHLHTELQKQTRFFKSDMSSRLGIAITFASGDGD